MQVGEPPLSFPDTLLQCIRRAFHLESNSAARAFYFDGSAYGIDEARGHPFHSGMALYRDFAWRSNYFHIALYELLKEDPTTLCIVLAYMNRGANKCHSQKVWVLC